MSFLEDLKSKILIGDGAMGTMLYSHGVDRCFEELNLSKPDDVIHVHEAYIQAGANLIQTNTYGANDIKLSRYGLEDEIRQINKQAVEIAKRAAAGSTYVFGTIGGVRAFKKSAHTLEEIKRNFREQLFVLLNEDVDGLLLETYYDFDELKTVLQIARKETNKPIITNVSLHEPGVLQDGTTVKQAFLTLEELGANVIGLNCRLGPYHMLQALEEVPLLEHAYLSVFPNSSLPALNEGRLEYESDEGYFKESALKFREQGARLIGGCCGTTPKHIKAMAEAVSHLAPITDKKVKIPKEIHIQSTSADKDTLAPLQEIVKEKRSVIVELDPPKKLGMSIFLEGAQALHDAGIDALTLADNSLASPRISNLAAGLLAREKTNARTLIHITCRDRNLIGLQSHLMGLHTLGLSDVLAITGDPSKIGDFPGATSVYDVSSFDLISLIKQFNEGVSYSGKPLGAKTNFSVAAAFNPNVRHLDKAVVRLEKKIACGADYFISQPLYSNEQIVHVYEATRNLKAPIYIGIMPLTSSRNAEFIHNEIPGIKLSDSIREKMAEAGTDKEKARQEGLAIAKDLIDTAFDLFNGIYLITPFLQYDLTVELTNYIHEKEKQLAERKITHV
ncbi:bifunctional homocysteine S-methyltransferase/methylenetetrahydrofolate reductase [Metabacillus sediminilitoris]|uniref:Bifunctional homocysteine S-methyltransferase/methylenetetrahydrofolate reductase n=1 Tax=Metabacillus sediminilitoris TaxID=2567941 RepID=A0A4S4BV91_9BACI|nr:bifunctional homocysteine S-methyltransferase/methylenetetrahydrofolate reductase [Metabacillus sediminilitoris]QGQ44630.1 bifunctional homocysteine S-methyltransferase/methylenetetrahydrofolate reductase [Metabacillus sediminilitoris]THF79021.1 bifunctional homocysteine S-methyltransferase/methylenetetrahydrofolate reductase [Metabacillus sediminilitoris]